MTNRLITILILGVLSLNTYLIINTINDKREITKLQTTLVDYGFAEFKVENNKTEFIIYPLDYGTFEDSPYCETAY